MTLDELPLTAVRDAKLQGAIEDFLMAGGDMHELKYVVQEAAKSVNISFLGLDTRINGILRRNNIRTVGDVLDLTWKQLMAAHGMKEADAYWVLNAATAFKLK